MNNDELLKYALEHGMINMSDVQEQVEMNKKVNYDKLRKMVTKEGIDIFESLKCLKK